MTIEHMKKTEKDVADILDMVNNVAVENDVTYTEAAELVKLAFMAQIVRGFCDIEASIDAIC